MRLGLHLSIRGSIDQAIDRATEIGCSTLQMFTRNPRGWRSKRLDPVKAESFRLKLRRNDVWPIFIHTPYLMNLASPKVDVYRRSVDLLEDELRRAIELSVPYVVTHLGSHLGYGKTGGFRRVIKAIDKCLSPDENNVALLLENASGTRNSIGSFLEDIKYIVSRIASRQRVGICLDTCHAYAAGYDLVSRQAVEHTLQRFNEAIGLKELKLVHLNDSLGGLGSGLDRHEHIGLGRIGEKGFKNILKSKLAQLPLILETPIDERRGDIENLRKVKELAQSR